MSDSTIELLMSAAREIGCGLPPVATLEEFEAACSKVLDHIQGRQDRDHARNGLRVAIEAARAGDAAHARGGLWEARKTLEHAHYAHLATAERPYAR